MNRTFLSIAYLLFAFLCFSVTMHPQTSMSLVATGAQQFGSFGGGPFDVVNLGNLNVHFAIPILHKAGRGTPFIYDLNYDSSIWTPVGTSGSQTWQPVVGMGWNGQNGINQFPQAGDLVIHSTTQWSAPCNPPSNMTLVTVTVYSGFTWSDPSGTTHGFNVQTSNYSGGCSFTAPPTTATAMATDGSPYQLNANQGSGTILSTANHTLYSPGAGSSVQDRNGNKISFSSSGTATDTLGQVAVTAAGGAPNPLTLTYSAPGGSAKATVTFKSYSVITNFQCSGIQNYSQAGVYLVDKITLADNTFYQFTYEQTPGDSNNNHVTARIASVSLPTGGTITYGYNYQDGTNGIVCPDGSTDGLTRTLNGGTWTYTRALDSQLSTHWTTTATTPTDSQNSPAAGNDTVIDFEKDCTSNSTNFYETKRTAYQGPKANDNPLLTTVISYQGTSCGNSAQVNSPITTRTVTLQYPNGLQAKTTTDYNATTGAVNDIYQSAYGSGAPGGWLRITTFQYSNSSLPNNPTAVYVQTGNFGTLLQTNYTYDEYSTYPLQTTSGTPQHVSATNSSRGNPTTITTYVNASTTLTRHFSYYDTGNVYQAHDVNGAVTTSNYDTTTQGNSTKSCGNSFPTSYTLPISGLSSSASTTWNCVGGVATTVTDLNGNSTVTTYNDPYFWRPASIQDPTTASTTFTYTPYTSSTNLSRVDSQMLFNSSSSAVEALSTVGQFGQVLYSQQREGPSSSNWDSTQVLYDSFLRAYQSTMPCVASAGAGCPSAATTTTIYDALGRVTKATDGGGGYISYSYSQNDVTQTVGPAPSGENLKKKQLEYDAIGRLTSVCEITSLSGSGTCSQTSSQPTGYYTTYAYGLNSSGYPTVTVTQNAQASSGQQTRVYTYDLLGRMISEQNPENGTTTNTYDSDSAGTCPGTYSGDLVKVVDAKGNIICDQYDALHRITSITYPSGPDSANTPSKTFVYDSATFNGIAMANPKGRTVEAYTGSSGSKTTDEFFSYSVRGEMTDTWECTPHSGTNGCASANNYYHVSAGFWENGTLKTLSSNISGLPTQTYSVDTMGRTSAVSASSGQNPVTSTTYNLSTFTYGVTFGSGDSDTFYLDPNTGRQKEYLFNVNGATDTGQTTWNANGSLASFQITDNVPGTSDTHTCNYMHDDLARIASVNCLNSATNVWNQTFTYDAFGNITKSSNGTGTLFLASYSSSTNWVNNLSGFGYDKNGQVASDGSHNYGWDVEGKMITVDTIALTYDALGRKVEKYDGTTYLQIVYGVSGDRFAWMSGQSLVKAFVPLPASVAIYTSSGLARFEHSDHLGSWRLSTTPSRTMYSSTAYAPFGELYAQAGTADSHFATGYRDELYGVLGMNDFMFRNQSTVQGRWLSPDPDGLAAVNPANPQSWNRYAYVMNNPMTLVDPLGLDCVYAYDDGSTYTVAGDCYSPTDNGYYVDGTVTNATVDPLTGDLMVTYTGGLGYIIFADAASSGMSSGTIGNGGIPGIAAPTTGSDPSAGAGGSGGGGAVPLLPPGPSLSCADKLASMLDDIFAERVNPNDKKGLAQRFRQIMGLKYANPNHAGEFLRRQRNLQKKIQDYRDTGCGDPPALVNEWATKPLVSPWPKMTMPRISVPSWVVPAAAVTGVVACAVLVPGCLEVEAIGALAF